MRNNVCSFFGLCSCTPRVGCSFAFTLYGTFFFGGVSLPLLLLNTALLVVVVDVVVVLTLTSTTTADGY